VEKNWTFAVNITHNNSMSFKTGDARPIGAGRKKGSKAIKTKIFEEYLDNKGIFMPDKAIELIESCDDVSNKDKIRFWIDLMAFVYPKKTAVKVEGEIGMTGHDAFLAAIEDARKNGK